MFEVDPLDQQMLLAQLSGVPTSGLGALMKSAKAQQAQRQVQKAAVLGALDAPQQDEQAAVIAQLQANPPKPQTSREVLDSVKPVPEPPPQMRAATPRERIMTPDADTSLTAMAGPAPAGGPVMRAPTTSERLKDFVGGVYGQIAKQPVGQLLDAIGATGFGAQARQMRGEEPTPAMTLGMMQDAPGGNLSEAVERGLYSRVDEAAKLIPKGGAHPNKIKQLLSSAPKEELEWRKVPEFLAAQGDKKVTPAQLLEHLTANPAPIPNVKTLGGGKLQLPEMLDAYYQGSNTTPPTTPGGWTALSDTFTARAQRDVDPYFRERNFRLAEEATQMAEGLDLGRGLGEGAPKYSGYQLPGGENYRETLLTLPKQPKESYSSFIDKMSDKYGEGYSTELLTREEQAQQHALWQQAQEYGHTGGRPDESQFRSSHYKDDPNLLVHTRANERTLPTGERGRFIEEVQSDWHQKGKKQGYRSDADVSPMVVSPDDITLDAGEHSWIARAPDGRRVEIGRGTVGDEAEARDYAQRYFFNQSSERQRELLQKRAGQVPDAPFKDTWQDLGLKQQILEAAKDPEASWIGHTGGKTQADRYDLSKQIGEVHYSGSNLKAYDHDGNVVMSQTGVSPTDLPDYIGKEAAEKLMAQPPRGTLRSLTGVDLQVGGEGMKHFYDNLLPKRLEKILKPFGGKVERGTVPGMPAKQPTAAEVMPITLEDARRVSTPIYQAQQAEFGTNYQPIDLAKMEQLVKELYPGGTPPPFSWARFDNLFTTKPGVTPGGEPMWFARLTPEMKQRILKEGLPLSVLLGLLGQSAAKPTEQPQ